MREATIHLASLTRTEAEVLRRWDAGESKEEILRRSGIHRTVVMRALGLASEDGTTKMHTDFRTGSAALLHALQREGMAA
jgi:hypothetical protein